MSNIIAKKQILDIIKSNQIIIPKNLADKINELNELIKSAALLGLFYVLIERKFWYDLHQHEIDYIHDLLIKENYLLEQIGTMGVIKIGWYN